MPHLVVLVLIYVCVCRWTIPPKVAPVPENTVFALFTDISEPIVIYSYLILHSGLLEHCLFKNVWFMHNRNILSTEIKHK